MQVFGQTRAAPGRHIHHQRLLASHREKGPAGVALDVHGVKRAIETVRQRTRQIKTAALNRQIQIVGRPVQHQVAHAAAYQRHRRFARCQERQYWPGR